MVPEPLIPIEIAKADTPPDQSRKEVRIEDIWGTLIQVTSAPTWSPRTLRESLAVNTSFPAVYYYDFTNQAWKVLTSGGSFQIKVVDDNTTLTTGDGKAIFCIPSSLNGLNLTSAQAFVSTVSSSGLPTVQIRNVTDSVDMLSTKISIDASEFTSYTAATPSVIDTTKDDVATGDRIAIDVDVAGTGAKGLGVLLTFA